MDTNYFPVIGTLYRLGFKRPSFLYFISNALGTNRTWLKVSYIEQSHGTILEFFLKIRWSDINKSHYIDELEVTLFNAGLKEGKKSCTVGLWDAEKFHLKEWLNLMEGRFVLNESDSWGTNSLFWYRVQWPISPRYGELTKLATPIKFDLEQKLLGLQVKDVEKDDVRETILSSLEDGNVPRVKMMVGGKLRYRYLSVDPVAGTITVSSRRRI